MSEDGGRLDPAIQAMLDGQLRPDECVKGWGRMPNDDVVVFLIDRDLDRACLPLADRVGRPALGRGRTLVFASHEGRWSLVGAGPWGMGPERLLRYFEAMSREEPGRHWRNGIEACRRWMAFYPPRTVTQSDVDQFLARLDAEPSPGAMWLDLRSQFGHWARARGFLA